MPAEVWRVEGGDDDVTGARLDGVVAPGTHVPLHRLVRLDAPYLDAYFGPRPSAHATRMATTTNAVPTIT